MLNNEILINYGLVLAFGLGVVMESIKPILATKQYIPLISLVVGALAGGVFSASYGLTLADGVVVGVLASTFADSVYNILRPLLVDYIVKDRLKKEDKENK